MSKAEERANERYSIVRGDDTEETSGIDMQRSSDFIEGYNQAEEDLALTSDDINDIIRIYEDVLEIKSGKDIYIEVLNQFNRQKGRQYDAT